MALQEPAVRSIVRPTGVRTPAMPNTVRPLPPPPARAFQVLQTHRAPTQLSLFSPPAAARPASR